MTSYTALAQLYDHFMKEIPYEDWAVRIKEKLFSFGIRDGIVCELGCGTGRMTRLLSEAGYDMIGIDSSVDMLSVARDNTDDESILYLCQDMREFELYGTVSAVVSVCDCLNYLSSEEELLAVFCLVVNYLDDGGAFIFDMLTPHYYRDYLADNVFGDSDGAGAYSWENFFDEKKGVNRCLLTFSGGDGDFAEEYEEEHIQYAYEPDRVRILLEDAGLHNIEICDENGGGEISPATKRMVFIARKGRTKG